MSSNRSLGQKTAFDTFIIVVLASVFARAINGSASFFPTIGSGFVPVLFHRALRKRRMIPILSGVSLRADRPSLYGTGNAGRSHARNHISEHELEEDMWLEAKTDDLSKIKIARVDRSDDISFVKQR
jgi:hypothetical protein